MVGTQYRAISRLFYVRRQWTTGVPYGHLASACNATSRRLGTEPGSAAGGSVAGEPCRAELRHPPVRPGPNKSETDDAYFYIRPERHWNLA